MLPAGEELLGGAENSTGSSSMGRSSSSSGAGRMPVQCENWKDACFHAFGQQLARKESILRRSDPGTVKQLRQWQQKCSDNADNASAVQHAQDTMEALLDAAYKNRCLAIVVAPVELMDWLEKHLKSRCVPKPARDNPALLAQLLEAVTVMCSMRAAEVMDDVQYFVDTDYREQLRLAGRL